MGIERGRAGTLGHLSGMRKALVEVGAALLLCLAALTFASVVRVGMLAWGWLTP